MKTHHVNIKKNIIAFSVLLVICSSAMSQSTSEDPTSQMKDKLYQPEELAADLDFLIENLKKHPQLYLYTPEAAYDHLWSAAYELTKEEQSIKKFYGIIAPIVEKVHCSHTAVRIPKKYLGEQNGSTYYFPLDVYALGNCLYTLDSDPENAGIVPPGSEILTINNVPVESILERLTSFIPSEGSVQTSKYNELNRNFKYYLNLLMDTDAFRIEYKDKEGVKRVKLKAGIKADEQRETAKAVPLDFYLEEKFNTGIIRVPSFAVMDMNGYMSKLDSIFLSLRDAKINKLVIDLRDNAGGHPIFAAQLLSYLCDSSFTYFKYNPLVNDFEPLYNPMQPNPNHFKGKLYILVNGGCLSTTGHLISLIDYHTSAVFIGEEPGSTYRCNDFSRYFALPNTGIELNVPGTSFETAIPDEAKDRPFSVDHEIIISPPDLINGEDAYMALLNKLIS